MIAKTINLISILINKLDKDEYSIFFKVKYSKKMVKIILKKNVIFKKIIFYLFLKFQI